MADCPVLVGDYHMVRCATVAGGEVWFDGPGGEHEHQQC